MLAPAEAMDTKVVTVEEAMQEIAVVEAPESVGIIVEVPKSPRTLRPKKDKQVMIPVCVSPRNPQRTKLTLQENGKAINLEADEEESEEILVDEEDLEMGVETQGADPITRLPEYVPSRKGKSKVSKDIDESKSSLQTPLLPKDIVFEGPHLGWFLVLKFEYGTSQTTRSSCI